MINFHHGWRITGSILCDFNLILNFNGTHAFINLVQHFITLITGSSSVNQSVDDSSWRRQMITPVDSVTIRYLLRIWTSIPAGTFSWYLILKRIQINWYLHIYQHRILRSPISVEGWRQQQFDLGKVISVQRYLHSQRSWQRFCSEFFTKGDIISDQENLFVSLITNKH